MPKPFYQVARGALLEKLQDRKWRVLAVDALAAAACCSRAAAIDAIDEVAPVKKEREPKPKEREKRVTGRKPDPPRY